MPLLVITHDRGQGGAMTTVADPSTSLDEAHGTDPGDPGRARRVGGPGERLDADAVRQFVLDSLAETDLDGARVCLVVPDGTRTCPLPLLLQAARDALAGRASEVTVVIALGTHHGMKEDQPAPPHGYQPGRSEEVYPGWQIRNHESWLPDTFVSLGTIGAERLTEL